jgi:hypothetical protein
MNHSSRVGLFSFFLIMSIGCSSNSERAEKELNAKISAERPANNPDEIANRAAMSFITTPGLSEDQRQKLMAVYMKTYLGAEEIRGEIGKSKSLMFKMIAEKQFDSPEMVAIKNKVVDLDQKRLNLMFRALEDVQLIVGVGVDKAKFYKHFEMYEVPVSVHGH